MKKNNKIVLIIMIIVAVLLIALGVVLLYNSDNSSKKGKDSNGVEKKEKYSLSELKFLNNINTNDVFTMLDSDVNEELVGTYAFFTSENLFDGSDSIIALKSDNTTVEIITIPEVDNFDDDIEYVFYSGGMLYYEIDDEYWSVSLTEGNGNYIPKNYEFLNLYLKDWFYIIENKIYYFGSSSYGLSVCDILTEECEFQVIDKRQSSGITINDKEINIDYETVYVEDDKFIYIMSEDGEDIYKIDINNPTIDDALLLASYTKVDKLGENAHLISETSKLKFNNIKFEYEYNDGPIFFIEYNNKRYDLEDNRYRPITLLPNNYLMVEHYTDEDSLLGEIEYINLKTGLKDENYSLEYTDSYGMGIYFINE